MAKKLTQLGRNVKQPRSPEAAVLEAVPNPHPDADYVVRFTAPEFTTLCPITGQPDFAHFVIDYVPGKAIVESKSLKLYLTSFRNVGSFHEATTIADEELNPAAGGRLLQVSASNPRIGAPLFPFSARVFSIKGISVSIAALA